MTPEEYMETIIESMIESKTGLPEDDERFFKVKARKHNPRISEPDIQQFWNDNSRRLLTRD